MEYWVTLFSIVPIFHSSNIPSTMIFVTGGTGLIGSQLLLDITSSGKKVRALKRTSSDFSIINRFYKGKENLFSNVDWVEGDVNDIFSLEDAMSGVTEVYHCAAFVSFHTSDFRNLMKTNVEGAANMVNVALEKKVEKFCMVSSTAALGRAEENTLLTEDTLWKTSKHNSGYAISKYGAEREAWRAMEEGLNAVIVNPSIVLGQGDLHSGSTALFGEVRKGLPFYTNGISGFVDVRDVTKCMLQLMEKNIFNQRFIISSQNLSYREVINFIADGFGKKHPSIKVNSLLSEIGWRVAALQNLFSKNKTIITKETARNGQRSWLYSNEKIKSALGIDFIPVERSVRDVCEIFLREKINSPP
jgi:nucleoside-diphosphate-sugar epimerase